MHYIRLLRPASVNLTSADAPVLSVKLAITTDLGDSFLSPAAPVELLFEPAAAESSAQHAARPLRPSPGGGAMLWKAGMRVLKADLPIPKAMARGRMTLHIRPRDGRHQLLSAHETARLLPWRTAPEQQKPHMRSSRGLIAPLTIELDDGLGSDIGVRELILTHADGVERRLEIEEEIGESIARHIWDAGLVSVALLADACRAEIPGPQIRDLMPIDKGKGELNVLELGCGVGVLGIGIANLLCTVIGAQGIEPSGCTTRVLLTDLPEAEERANANIRRFQEPVLPDLLLTEVAYENLDWEDGARGTFGTLVASRFWDYVVLSDCTYNVDSFPVLVGTLSALHRHNQAHPSAAAGDAVSTKVILSTKPRHDSEKALFGLLATEGWTYRLLKSIPLPRLDGESEAVEVYSLEKRDEAPGKGTKRGIESEEDERPAKRTPPVST